MYKSILNFSETRDANVQSHESNWSIMSPFTKLHENGDCHFSKLGKSKGLTQFHKIFVMCNTFPSFFLYGFSLGGNF